LQLAALQPQRKHVRPDHRRDLPLLGKSEGTAEHVLIRKEKGGSPMNIRKNRRFVLRPLMASAMGAALAACSSMPSMPWGGSTLSDPVAQQPNATFQAAQIVGGGTKEMSEGVQPVGGFLPQPGLLKSGGPGRAALVYLNPNVNMATYKKVMIDPVTIWAGPKSGLNGVPADQQRALANVAYSDIYNALRDHCMMVQNASPNTMHFRFALIDTSEPNAVLNTVATYAPYASTAYSAASFAFNHGVGYFSGTATGEGFATDSVNGTLLWEAVDKRGGTTAVVADTLDNWRDVHHVFEAWGIQLRTRLQELGVCRR
jgi:hypothetical protein